MRMNRFVTIVMMMLTLGVAQARQLSPLSEAAQAPAQPAQPAPTQTPVRPAQPAPASAPARAQPPVPAPAPTPVAPTWLDPPAPGPDQPNIQFDIAISDEGGGYQPVKKNVVLLAQAGGAGSLRSSGVGFLAPNAPQAGRGNPVSAELNVDVKMPRYSTMEPNKIRARVGIEYQPFSPEWKSAPGRIRAQVDAMLENGKKTILWQTADPVSGLRTTIEVTATVLK